MSGIRLGRVFFDLITDTSQFERSMKRSRSRIKDLNRAMVPTLRLVRNFGLAAAGAAAGLAYLGKTTADTVDRQAKLAQSLRTSIGSIQVLDRAAELSGVKLGQMEAGLRVMEVQLSRLAEGSAPVELMDAFQNLNLEINSLIGLPLDKKIATITKAVKDFIPKTQQAAVLAQLFGSRAFLAFDRIGSGGTLDTAISDIDRFGGRLSDVAGDDVEAMNDSLSSLTTAFQGMTSQIVAAAAPAVQRMSDHFAEALESGSDFRNRLGDIAELVGNAGPRIAAFTAGIVATAVAMKGLTLVVATATTGLVALRGAMIRTGFLAVAAGVGDLIYRMKGLGDETGKYAEGVRTLADIIRDSNQAKRDALNLSNAELVALRKETSAKLEAAEAELARGRAALKAHRERVLASDEYAAAVSRLRRNEQRVKLHAPEGEFPLGGDTQLLALKSRVVESRREIDQMLGVPREQTLAIDARRVAGLRERLNTIPAQTAVPGLPAAGGGGVASGGAPEFTVKELADNRVSFIKKIEDAELKLGTETQRRIAAVRRERETVIESLAEQKAAYEQLTGETGEAYTALADRANAAFDELDRRARGHTTYLERLAETAQDVGKAVGDFAHDAIMNYRDAEEAAKSMMKAIASSVVRKTTTDRLSGAIATAISGWGAGFGGGTTANPHTRADGGPAHGWTIVGERGRELVHFGQPGTVLPNQRTERMLAGTGTGGAFTIDINVNAGRDWDALQSAVMGQLSAAAPQIVETAYMAVQGNLGRPGDMRSALQGA